MAWYTLECPNCGVVDEYQFDAKLDDKQAKCVECDTTLRTTENRLYGIDKPRIEGETCAGSCTYEQFDEGLDEYVTSKQHRKELMKRKGLTEYNPDPTMKKHRDEARYIRNRSKTNDPDAHAAIRKEYKTAGDKRRKRLVKESLDKSFKSADA